MHNDDLHIPSIWKKRRNLNLRNFTCIYYLFGEFNLINGIKPISKDVVVAVFNYDARNNAHWNPSEPFETLKHYYVTSCIFLDDEITNH